MEDAEFSHGVLETQIDDVPADREPPYSSAAGVLFTLYSLELCSPRLHSHCKWPLSRKDRGLACREARPRKWSCAVLFIVVGFLYLPSLLLPLLTLSLSCLPYSSPAGPRAQKGHLSLPWGMRTFWENTPVPRTTVLALQGPPQ